MQMQMHVLSIKYGDFEGRPWAKIVTLSDDVQKTDGFNGQDVTEVKCPSDSANSVVQALNGKLPAKCELTLTMETQQKVAVLKVVGAKVLSS